LLAAIECGKEEGGLVEEVTLSSIVGQNNDPLIPRSTVGIVKNSSSFRKRGIRGGEEGGQEGIAEEDWGVRRHELGLKQDYWAEKGKMAKEEGGRASQTGTGGGGQKKKC